MARVVNAAVTTATISLFMVVPSVNECLVSISLDPNNLCAILGASYLNGSSS